MLVVLLSTSSPEALPPQEALPLAAPGKDRPRTVGAGLSRGDGELHPRTGALGQEVARGRGRSHAPSRQPLALLEGSPAPTGDRAPVIGPHHVPKRRWAGPLAPAVGPQKFTEVFQFPFLVLSRRDCGLQAAWSWCPAPLRRAVPGAGWGGPQLENNQEDTQAGGSGETWSLLPRGQKVRADEPATSAEGPGVSSPRPDRGGRWAGLPPGCRGHA